MVIKMKTDKERVNNIFTHLRDKCGGSVLDMQGACAILAMHIYLVCNCTEQNIIGGYLTSSTGWRRAHWWIEKGGIVYDPIGDCYTCEPGFKRVVEHRGRWDDFAAEYERECLRLGGMG
jgi:hypothetical protein